MNRYGDKGMCIKKVLDINNNKKHHSCVILLCRMGRRKRLCIMYSNEKEVHNSEEGDTTTEEHNEQGGDIPTEENNAEQEDPIPTEEGPPKKVRGYTRKSETWNMNNSQKIVVTFNKNSRPIGEEGNELTQFMGTLVRVAENVGIDFPEWRMVPDHKKEDLYLLVKAKFVFDPAETHAIKSWIIGDMGKKWRTWKGLLKERAFDKSLTIEEIVAKHCEIDKRVNPDQFKTLVTQWFDPHYEHPSFRSCVTRSLFFLQIMCNKKSENRKKMEEPHVSGTKSYARLAHEEHLKTLVYPSRGQIYVKAHTRKFGKSVPDKVNQVMASLASDSSSSTHPTTVDPFDYSNDDYSKVKGPEKRGYIRCVGRIPAVKASSSSTDPTVGQMKTLLGFMGSIINNLAPNPELSSILKSMNIQMPNTSTGSTSTVNQSSSSESDQMQGKMTILPFLMFHLSYICYDML
ncbi:hypothetical protein LXL04_037663 [Taraxacum kok-saghyz]